jgi:hypothetical protein
MFLGIGLFMSSLVKSQIVAAMIAMVVGLVFVVTAFWRPMLEAGTWADRIVTLVSIPQHFRLDFCRGILDTRHLVLYLSVTLLTLFLTIRSIEARRLRA